MINRSFVFFCMSGALAILFGAFGAHALKSIVTPDRLVTFDIGVRYQMYQSLFGLFLTLYCNKEGKLTKLNIWSLRFSQLGLIIFSGSLYLLVLLDKPSLGAITPVGGSLMILSWLTTVLFFIKKP